MKRRTEKRKARSAGKKQKLAQRKLKRQLRRLNRKLKRKTILLKGLQVPYGSRMVLRWNDDKHIMSLYVGTINKSQLGKMLKKYGGRRVVSVEYNKVGFFIVRIQRTTH